MLAQRWPRRNHATIMRVVCSAAPFCPACQPHIVCGVCEGERRGVRAVPTPDCAAIPLVLCTHTHTHQLLLSVVCPCWLAAHLPLGKGVWGQEQEGASLLAALALLHAESYTLLLGYHIYRHGGIWLCCMCAPACVHHAMMMMMMMMPVGHTHSAPPPTLAPAPSLGCCCCPLQQAPLRTAGVFFLFSAMQCLVVLVCPDARRRARFAPGRAFLSAPQPALSH